MLLTNVVKQFKDGFFAPFWGLKYLFQKRRLLAIASIPTLANIVIFALITYLSYSHFGRILAYFMDTPETWYKYILFYLLGFLLIVLIILIICFSFTIIGNIIASPFNDVLARKVEKYLSKAPEVTENNESIGSIFGEFGRMIKIEIKKLIFSIAITVIVLTLSFVLPFLSFIGWITTVVLITFQFIDYIFEVHRLSFSARVAFLVKNLFLCMGFGFACSLFISIPIVGFLGIPMSVIGATKIYKEYANQ